MVYWIPNNFYITVFPDEFYIIITLRLTAVISQLFYLAMDSCLDMILPNLPVNSIAKESSIFAALFVLLA